MSSVCRTQLLCAAGRPDEACGTHKFKGEFLIGGRPSGAFLEVASPISIVQQG